MNRREALAMLAALPGIACGKASLPSPSTSTITVDVKYEYQIGVVTKIVPSVVVVEALGEGLERTGESIVVPAEPSVCGLNCGQYVAVARMAIGERPYGEWFITCWEVQDAPSAETA